MALKEIADLYNKGGAIKPSLDAPEEISDEFPKISQLQSIESKVKKIEEAKKKWFY